MSPEGTKEIRMARIHRNPLSSLRDFFCLRVGHRLRGLTSPAIALRPFGAILLLAITSQIVIAQTAPTVDTPNYWNQAWRDSVNEYHGRVEAYHQEFYSYDWGITFAMLPVMGEWYVDKTMTGVRFSIARGVSLGASAVGLMRMIGDKQPMALNVGLLAGGIVGWALLKWWEITDVVHTVSQRDEALVEKYRIETPDIEPRSIRYPTKEWPAWVTSGPEPRHPQQSKEAINKPMPMIR